MRYLFFILVLFTISLLKAQPVKDHGRLSVNGTQLIDATGNPVVLRGMSFGWHNFWPKFYNQESVKWLAKDWKCSVVRAAMGVEPDRGYIKDPVSSQQKVEAVIDGAIKANIYVIIDWHSHNIRLKEAKEFFTKIATKYGKYPNVIYEIFNEPDQESWADVKAYSTQLISTIRAIDPNNVILVGNPHWDQDIHAVAADPITNASNIMYTVHFYAATHKEWLRNRCDSALQKGIPIFISESAGMEASGDGALNNKEWKLWLDWAEQRKISWVTWSVSDKDETCSVLKKSAASTGKWKTKDLKESGIRSRAYIRTYASKKVSTNNSTTIEKDNVEVVLPAKSLFPFGRYTFNDDGKLELISSAVNFGFSFTGTTCKIFASIPEYMDHNYLQYELDGVYQKRIRISKNAKEPINISATGEGDHTVWMYKATEAHTGPIFIKQIAGFGLKPLKRPTAPLIEFIGNSITCGAAADQSEVPCGTGEYHDQHNAYQAYGPRVARALKTNFILSSVSGIGIYRNWNSDGPTMPQVYEKIDFQENNKLLCNFSTYSPRVVSIALGTNDFSRGDGVRKRLPFDSAAFVREYIGFVQKVKGLYPVAQIALLSSPMTAGDDRRLLQRCLQAVKTNVDNLNSTGKRVALYFFNPMQAHGCSGHPNVADHEVMADELIPFFKGLL